jgi:hypothetical protein
MNLKLENNISGNESMFSEELEKTSIENSIPKGFYARRIVIHVFLTQIFHKIPNFTVRELIIYKTVPLIIFPVTDEWPLETSG